MTLSNKILILSKIEFTWGLRKIYGDRVQISMYTFIRVL